MTDVEWWDYADRETMAGEVAGDIAFLLGQAIEGHGSALAAFPGGTSPERVFRALAGEEVDWKKVTIIPTDERCVPETDALSNVARLRAVFAPLGAAVRPLAEADALRWPPDVVWLGMGADGHTASIFPGPDLAAALMTPRRTQAVRPEPLPDDAPVSRLTLTKSAILAARALLLTIEGEAKRRVLEKALADGPGSGLPVGRLLADAEQAIDIHWCP
ncbi:6-phosphogluconolactonase [Thermaurantiacus sp.]